MRTYGLLFLSFALILGVTMDLDGKMKLSLDVPVEQLSSQMEERIPRLMADASVPGFSLTVVRDGVVLWSKGFGVKRAGSSKPVTESTVFEAASLSKPVFAYAVLKLSEKGLIDLDAPLITYVKELYIEDTRVDRITARLVLNHMCGLPNYTSPQPKVEIKFEPDERFSYSTEGFRFLQMAVEQIVGEPLQNYLVDHLFKPFRMMHSSYVWMDSFDADVGFGHDEKGGPSSFRREHKEANAGITLHTRPLDYAQLLIEMMATGEGDEFRLSQKSLQQMLGMEARIDDHLSWGLGWGLERTDSGTAFWHWGDVGTYKNFIVAFREQGVGIVIRTNSENGLTICEAIVTMAIDGDHPAFLFPMMRLRGG